jgi:thiol-disulfide isomerase/thioredoxin
VVAVVSALVAIVALGRSPAPATSASTRAIREVTHVPARALASAVPGSLPQVHALPPGTPPVETGGKPVLTYVGAEYCPYCAAERWPLVVALSRFGRFSHLEASASASNDVFPSTPTLSFHGAAYTSPYLSLSAVETSTNRPAALGGYTSLDAPTAQQQELLNRYDTTRYTGTQGAIPFVMVGSRYVWAGATYSPAVLGGLSFDQIAARLADPTTTVGRTIDAQANAITAMICQLTGDQPSPVCSTPSVARAVSSLPGS